MEKDRNKMQNPDDSPEYQMGEKDWNADKTVFGKEIEDEGSIERSQQQADGNRKYETHRNHSSADDKPQVNIDRNPERGRL